MFFGGVVLYDAEAITEQSGLSVDICEYGGERVGDDLSHLSGSVFGVSLYKQIGAACGMNVVDLMQEIHNAGDIRSFGFSYCHILWRVFGG